MRYESSKSIGSKVIGKVNVFMPQTHKKTQKQTDRQAGQKLDAPNLVFRGHKNTGS